MDAGAEDHGVDSPRQRAPRRKVAERTGAVGVGEEGSAAETEGR